MLICSAAFSASDGLEAQRQRVESQIADVRRMLGGSTEAPAQTAPEAAPRRKLSGAAKARIAATQRARWAKARAEAEQPKKAAPAKRSVAAEAKPKKRRTSARWPEGHH